MISQWFILFCYIFFAYGFSNMVVFGSGPFRVFEKLRETTERINPHFGQMFQCMMCFPANLGWIISIVNWFLIPIAITPGNMIFDEIPESNLWYAAMIFDCCFTSGMVWFIHHIEEWFENLAEGRNTGDSTGFDDEDDSVIDADDITLKNG
jgi:hypothetical protein